MKTLLSIAAALAAITSASVAFAHDAQPSSATGHWEWQPRPTFGPNKSNLPPQLRVWVKDSSAEVASCNCDMMKMSAADCMMDMQGKRAVPSAG